MSLELQNTAEVPQVGLNLSADPTSYKEGDYSYMLNGCLSDPDGRNPFVRMYKGNRMIDKLPPGYFPIGNTNVAQKDVCLFLVNISTGDSEIGVFNGSKYTKVAGSTKLGFKIHKQIQAAVDENFNNGKTVIWVDDNNDIRHMDLNNPPMLNGELDIDALNVFRKYEYPQATIAEIASGGRILAGSYYISLQYADENGNGLTACTTPVGPIHIYRDNLAQPKPFINGSPEREPTDKAIKVNLSNLDKSFRYVNVIVVKSYSGIRSAVITATVPTFQTNYLYTGIVDTERDITLDAVLTPGVSYKSAKTISLSNGVCVLGNLKGKKEFNFQPFINEIGLQWQLVKEKYDNAEASYANPLRSLYQLQFRRNEIYDLGLVIRWTDGSKSRVYPLIGRKKNFTSTGMPINKSVDEYGTSIIAGWDTSPALNNDDIADPSTALPERWKQMNTAFVVGDDLADPNGEGASTYGEFGYHESTDLWPDNPDVYGSNAGMPIRRFKMPDYSIAPIMDGKNMFRSDTEIVSIYRMGIRFANIEEIMNSLPDSIKSDIAGYELVRADRRNNKSVIGSGVLFNMWYQNWLDSTVSFPFFGGSFPFNQTQPDDIRLYPNYPLNDLNPDPLIDKVTIGTDTATGHTPNDRYRKDVFTFLSPDTSFEKNLLFSSDLLIHSEIYGTVKTTVSYLNPYPELQDKGNSEYKSAYQMLALGTYNNWKPSVPGRLRRKVQESMYIPFNSQVSSGVVGLPIQNITRESTVLVSTTKEIADPTIEDTSRAVITDADWACNFDKNPRYRTGSLYYVSLVAPIANQYGSVFDPRYCFTNYDNSNIKNGIPIFGGDSYISPFSIKRQLMFYQNAQAFKDQPDGELGIDLKNSETINNTRYHYEALRKKARTDSDTQCESGNAIAKMPVIYTGIPVIYCESDYNIDLRGNGTAESETFYPNLKDGSLSVQDWTGIKNVDKDNDYRINASYNEINDLFGYQNADPFYNPNSDEVTHFSTRSIFSLPGSPENRFNNLLVFLPLNYHDFPRDAGELTDIRDVGNYRMLFRFQHAFYIHRLYAKMATEEGNINLGSGKLFETQPERLSKSDDGYSGSSEQWAFNNTPFGAFCTDAKRGTEFIFGKSLNDIGANAAEAWLLKNMPFHLIDDIPTFPHLDNPANPEGIGFHSIYDSDSKLWIITKRDYELIDKEKKGEFTIQDGELRMNNGSVSLSDKAIFHDRSWTMAYDPRRQRYIGWFSFKPTHYFQLGRKYYSFSDGQIWCHDNILPRTYYGKRYPFVIETVLKTAGTYVNFTSSFLTRAFPIVNGRQMGESFEETFNKGYICNEHQSTGMFDLTVQDENDLSTILRDPVITNQSAEKFLRKLNQQWNIDELYDMVVNHNQPFFLPGWENEIDHSNIDYLRDYKEAAVFRDLWSKHRYIYDKEKDVQLYLYMLQSVTQISIK